MLVPHRSETPTPRSSHTCPNQPYTGIYNLFICDSFIFIFIVGDEMKGRKRRRREERKTEAKCRKSRSLERKRQRKMELGVRNFAFFLTGSIR